MSLLYGSGGLDSSTGSGHRQWGRAGGALWGLSNVELSVRMMSQSGMTRPRPHGGHLFFSV